MRICAYDELYLPLAQRVMGDMFDYAVNILQYSISEFHKMFIACGIAHQIEVGNPMYVAGMNGCEVAKDIIETCGFARPATEDVMQVDKSQEYWIGWALAYYQWTTDYSFYDIEQSIHIEELYKMYPVFHEMDIAAFVEAIDERVSDYMCNSRLRRLRTYAELSQSGLSRKSGVSIRQIQLFEQGKRDISKTQGETLTRLSKALGCEISRLID